MTGLEIAALAALVAGSYMQYQANTEAADRQQEAIRRSLEGQAELQKQAEKKALDSAAKFAPGDRATEKAAIEEQITTDLMAPVSESQAIRAQQSTTQGNVSNDYSEAKAKSTAESLKSAEQLARLLGKTTSANRLQMNEGIRLMDTGQAIDQLNSFSRGQQAADQIGIQVAGRPDAEKIFMGSLLQAGGSAGLSYAGAGGGATNQATTAQNYGTQIGSQQTTMLAAQDAGMNSSWLDALKRMKIGG